MRLTLALVAALAATPLTAADGHRMLSSTRSWNTIAADGCGLACSDNGIRRATDIPAAFQQNRKGWLNSADATVIESKLFEPGHGLSVLRGQVMDGQDEGTTRVEVFDFGGNKIFDKLYGYKGPKADGEVKTWAIRAADHGKTGWRGVTIRYSMTDEGGGPNRKPNKNGISFVHTYRADPACQPLQNAERGRAAERTAKAGDKKAGGKATGTKASGNKASGNKSGGNKSGGNKSGGNKSGGTKGKK